MSARILHPRIMRHFVSIGLAILLCSCTIPPRTTVQIVDERGRPVEGFPIRFKLDEGMTQSDYFTPVSQSLKSIDDQTFEGNTDANGEIGISYYFTDRQPSDWRMLLFDAEPVSNKHVLVTPLKDLPKGTEIKVGIPNP